jgi:hypothetical protein
VPRQETFENKPVKCVDVQSWRASTNQEILQSIKEIKARVAEEIKARSKDNKKRKKSSARDWRGSYVLAVRQQLSPVDVYCYLKARFGEPKGLQNFLRTNDSGNWIHWEFDLKADDQNVHVLGTSRETHFMVSENLTDENWRDLILGIKADYKRVAKEKSVFLKSLEHWVTFSNKFFEVANICADLHGEILDNIGGFQVYKPPSCKTKREYHESHRILEKLSERASKLYRHCLELSLLTPVLAEAFINMLILILCKQDVRDNKRQFDEFIRADIDVKLFDLHLKCKDFARPIDHNSEKFKNFKKVMDKRNHAIHGNCDPEREKIEEVYFEGTRPLFKESGDIFGKYFEALERQYQPDAVIKDYENTYAFLLEIMACLNPISVRRVWRIMEDRHPGYDTGRKTVGTIFSDIRMKGLLLPGVRYDDELAVTWS